MPGPVYELRDGQGQTLGPVDALYAPLNLFAAITPTVNRMEPRGVGEAAQFALATVYNNGGEPVTVRFGRTERTIPAYGHEVMKAPAGTKVVKVFVDDREWCNLTEFPVGGYCDD